MTGAGSSPTTQRTPRWVVGGLAVLIAAQLIAGVTGAAVLTGARHARQPSARPAAVPATAGTPTRPAQGSDAKQLAGQTRTGDVRALLDRRAQALLRRDRPAFLAGIDPHSPAFRAQQAKLFDDLAGVPLSGWSYALDPSRSLATAGRPFTRYAAPVWAPAVSLSYRLAGFDARPTEQREYFTFVRRGSRWYIGSDTDFLGQGDRSARGLWDFGRIAQVRQGDVLVLGHPGSLPTMRLVADTVAAAVPRVTAVWGQDWDRKVVALVPASQNELAEIIQDSGDLSQIAAVATADLGGPAGHSPAGERILVNPANFAKLGAVGRRVVLTHEVTHVASRAVTSSATPVWLAEGFADYVGYLGTGVAVTTAAGELAQEVRGGKLPAHLPTVADFAGSNPALSQAYEEAWLACRLIAGHAGQDGLVRFYRAVSRSSADPATALDDALHSQLHESSAQFTKQWQSYLREQLG